jgi:hypothetical protein
MIWNTDFSQSLLRLGYVQSKAEPCLFVKGKFPISVSLVLIFVDDVHHWCNDNQYQVELFEMIKREFSEPTLNSSDIGIGLGIEYNYFRNDPKGPSVRLTMRKYTREASEHFGITSGAKTPATADFMEIDDSSPPCDRTKFASGVMTYYYLFQRTRKDLLIYAAVLATRINDARVADAEKLNRLMRFTYATEARGVVLRFTGTRLVVYVDASYNIYPNSRSQTGVYVTLCDETSDGTDNGGAALCRSSVQRLVARASFDSENIALDSTTNTLFYLRDVISDIGIDQVASLYHEDNMALIVSIEQGENFRGKSPHMRARIHRFAQLVEARVVEIRHCATEDMIADPLTKPLFSRAHLHSLMRLLNDYGNALGDVYDEAAMSR